MTPLDKLIDEACGIKPGAIGKLVAQQRRQQDVMTHLLQAVENWYADDNERNVELLQVAWRNVVATDKEIQ